MTKYKHSILFVMRLIFLAGLTTLFYIGWQMGYQEATFFYAGNYMVVFVYIAIAWLFFGIYGGWKIGEQRLLYLIQSGIISLFFTNVIMYTILCLVARRLLSLYEITLIFLIQILWCVIAYYFMNRVYFALREVRSVVAICSDDEEDKVIIEKMNSLDKRFHIVKQIDCSLPLPIICEEIIPFESVLIGKMEETKRTHLLEYCYKNQKRINLVPSPMDIIMHNAVHTQIVDMPILFLKNNKLKTEQKLAKRVLDLVLSSIGLVITSPFFLITAIAIKIEDGGPVFFRQDRLTEGGRHFQVIKFRSMRVDAEKGKAMLAQKNDSRITRVGELIRKVRIDELPQLINVLYGDMSLVGPRPERPEFYEIFEKQLPEFALRLKVKAGLTGYAQIYGRYNTTPKDKLNLDLFYIENYSFLLDIRLIMTTFKILFMKESTDGFSQEDSKGEKKEEVKKDESESTSER